MSANRGALPYHLLDVADARYRVLVPLPAGESIWVALMLHARVTVVGRAAEGRELRIAEIGGSHDTRLLAADAIVTADGARALDADGVVLATTPLDCEGAHLTFAFNGADGSPAGALAVIFGSPALYARLSGLPAPAATSADEAYGGWRLP